VISVLILTFNEEINIRQCIESVSWSDDVVVLDSFSTDRTVAIAHAAGARILQNHFVNFADQRNFGVRHGGFKHGWLLHLDADEVVTPELKGELIRVIQTGRHVAYRISSKLIFQGQWLRRSSMYPCYQVRLGRRDALGFVQVGHGQRENLPPSALGTLDEPLEHYCFSKGLEDWFAKHNRYSSAEAAENLKLLAQGGMPWKMLLDTTKRWRALKEISVRLPFRPALRFFYAYFLRLGFLDGVAGWHYCRMLSIYESMIVLKIRELQAAAGSIGRLSHLHTAEDRKHPVEL
jgi:glycosyltransferase involved in cell wall biosynthesis